MAFLFAILTALVLAALLAIPAAAIVMLCIGAAHSHYEAIPALGFAPTFWLVLALRFASTSASAS